MSEEKKTESISLLNRSMRSFDVSRDGKPFRHGPQKLETYSLSDAKQLEGYKELVDVSKIPGTVDTRQLKANNEALADENKRLKEQLAAMQAPEPKKSKKRDEVEA